MVLANHLIITAYGFWLPNEERGSWSDFVGSWELWKSGDATDPPLAARQCATAPGGVIRFGCDVAAALQLAR